MKLSKLGRALEVFATGSLVFSALVVAGTLDLQAETQNTDGPFPTLPLLVFLLSAATVWFLQELKRN